jgi:L-alanine-DL-glutamate epimerase-like enolase superfamily enzyme
VLDLIKADACDVFVVYPSEAGGLRRAHQIGALADAAGKWCAIGSWAELGVATAGNIHVAGASSNFPFASDTHYPLQELDVLVEPLEMADGLVAVPRSAGLGIELDPEAVQRLSNFQVRESVFYDDIHGEAPRVGQIL